MSRTKVLLRYGIVDRLEMIVHAVKEADVLWRFGIHGHGDPLTALSTNRALELSEELRRVGEEALANRIVMEVERTHRYNVTGP